MYRIEEGFVYKAIARGDDTAVMKVGPAAGGLSLELLEMPKNAAACDGLMAAAVAYVREWFDLDRDLSPFYELASGDRLLQEPVRQFNGLRLMGIPDLFEALCWGIIGQQINLAFAYTLKRRLIESYGMPVEAEGVTYWLFPKPELIASLSVSDLEPLRMTVKKCEYLIGAAEAIVSGAMSKERLNAAGSLKEAEKLLTGMRGIGPWTAHYAIMRCLRLPDAFPIDDVGLHNAVKLQLGMDRKPTKPELIAMSEGWRGWEAYVTFYLWRLLY
ncbi:DNA-3-methyladenine glycosylase 2 family protein [Paenibacillus paeoniae]|uniref:DNA-3-methyladenine glycosylase II n=2 Tax=Paenibacillus paeoniae TaxID=2292705 RepID=A0A371P6V7_9BACL|nr:DNA-3-methyladenine glycosylase 2 family protein [Paenibacillus paeoniae]